jgi:sugar/nucleoside kinase (ribokinase family)
MDKIYDVYGIGNPLVDILVHVRDRHLQELHLNKGIMHLINEESRNAIIDKIKDLPQTISAGGDCPNTIVALAMCGLKAVLSGKIGDDYFGELFEKKVMQKGVISGIVKEKGITGSSIILISEDSERTMNTFLGKCRDFSKKDLDIKKLKQSRYLYFTGYMWDTDSQKEATLKAIETAKLNNVLIAFDVADPFAVKRYKEDFLKIIRDHADIVFANEEEAKILFDSGTPEDAVLELSKYCEIAVVKCGARGSFIKKDMLTFISGFKTQAVDTTGAGDMYAAGFLYSLCMEYDIELCGKIASFLASKVVSRVGAQLDEIPFEELKKIIIKHKS